MKTITNLKQFIRLISFIALLTFSLNNYSNAQCTTPVFTLSENFNTGLVPSCWSPYVLNGSTSSSSNVSLAMELTTLGGTSAAAAIITPRVNNCRGILNFVAHKDYTISTDLKVGVISSPTNIGSFILVAQYSLSGPPGTPYVLDMSTYTGNYQYIVFYLDGGNSNFNKKVRIDNINYSSACESTSSTAIAQNTSVQLGPQGTVTVLPSSINNNSTTTCGAPTLSMSPSYFTCADIGANTVVLTATDNMGNTSTANATVTILPAITNETVTATTPALCTNSSTTITTGSSVAGINYFLRNNANNAVVVGPIVGTGSALTFNTGPLTTTTTYNVYGETQNLIDPNFGLTFDGTNDYVNMPCLSSFNYGTAYTVEGWFKAPVSGAASRCLFYSGTNSVSDIEIYTQGASNKLYVIHNRGKAGITISAKGFVIPPLNVWYHLAVTYDGTTIKLYVNGVEQTATDNVSGMALTKSIGAELAMGYVKSNALNNWGFSTFLGQMDEIRVWNDVRTNAEILANKDNCLIGNESGLVSYYKLNDGTAAIATDITNNQNGTLTNMTPNTNWILGTISCPAILTSSCYREMSQLVTVTVGADNVAPSPAIGSLPNITAQCSVTSLTPPSANDNCAGQITGTHNATFPITATTTVIWTYNDGNGNSSTQNQSVIINDNVGPVANVSSLSNIGSQCSVTTLTAPTATDNCSGTITGTRTVTLPITTPGTTVVTWTYNDGHGNITTQNQNVIINDNIAPVANISSLPNITAQCSVTTLTAPTATDNCSGTITGTRTVTLPITTPGTTVVTWTYNDGHGNITTQNQNVIINDNIAPVANVSSLPNITAQCSVSTLTAPTASDNCSGTITGTKTVTLPITNSGTTIVTWTYNDGHGNITTQNQNIIINDNVVPIANVTTLPNITATCSVTTLTAPTASDNCSGTIVGTKTVTLPITNTGTTVVTWTYNDGHGNITTQNQNVIINDNIAPVANSSSLANITSQCSVTSLTAPLATDNCSGTVMGTHNATLPITTSGTTIVIWTYNDGHGNSSTQTQNVIINDNIAPVANVGSLPNITAQCSVSALTAPTATDNCAGSITGTHNVTLPITAQGTTLVTWTYNDGNGNSSTQIQSVVINDNISPVLNVSSLPNITAQCSVSTLISPTATDNCSGSITGTHNATLPITAQGTTVVTWTFSDGHGNTATQTQSVVINDNLAPVANTTSLPNITAQCSVSTLTVPTATDNCSGVVVGTHNATLPISNQGTTIVTWTFSDGHGNTSTQSQSVIITDNLAPVANATSLPNITAQCSVLTLTPPTATDNCAGLITGTHNVTLPISNQGTTIVTWTFSDGHGNSSTLIQNVVINDNIPPVANSNTLPDVNEQCSITSLTAPAATDNCAGAILGTHNVTLPITTQGLTVVIWSYDDGNGNISTQNQNVNILDNTNPVPDLATLNDVTEICSVNTLTAPFATDNCSGSITGTHNATLPITAPGTTVVVWTYTDASGNISTQNQNIIINPIDATVSVNGPTISANYSGATSYQWVNCNNGNAVIPGATNSTYTPSPGGNFAVIVTVGSCSETSICTIVSTTGIQEMDEQTISIFPNPSSSVITIKAASKIEKIEIYDASGKHIRTLTQSSFSIEELTNGVYFMYISTDNGKSQSKFIKE